MKIEEPLEVAKESDLKAEESAAKGLEASLTLAVKSTPSLNQAFAKRATNCSRSKITSKLFST